MSTEDIIDIAKCFFEDSFFDEDTEKIPFLNFIKIKKKEFVDFINEQLDDIISEYLSLHINQKNTNDDISIDVAVEDDEILIELERIEDDDEDDENILVTFLNEATREELQEYRKAFFQEHDQEKAIKILQKYSSKKIVIPSSSTIINANKETTFFKYDMKKPAINKMDDLKQIETELITCINEFKNTEDEDKGFSF